MKMTRPSADAMLAATQVLKGPFWTEFSVKLTRDGVRADRGTSMFPRSALYPGPKRTLSRVLDALACPGLGEDMALVKRVNMFGFGADEKTAKVYFEFALPDRPEEDLPLIAWKWRGDHLQRCDYRDRGFLMHAEKHMLAEAIAPPATRAAAAQALDLGLQTDPQRSVMVLHMIEETGRRHFDISLVDSRMTLGETAGIVQALFGAFGHSAEGFLGTHADARLSHISLGGHDTDAPYATIYYGLHHVS